jgi:hypothetical protein
VKARPARTTTVDVDRLRGNAALYETLLAPLAGGRFSPAAKLGYVASVAAFAATWHPGRFADGRLENPALDAGRELSPPPDLGPERWPRRCGRRHVVHVATALTAVGGHTRTIKNWIATDRESRHSVVILRQDSVPVPGWLAGAVDDAGGRLVIQNSDVAFSDQAAWLRVTAERAAADVIVLHQAPGEAVPTAAFAVADGPPVALVNHADHVFWLGSGVADVILSHRKVAVELSATRRFAADVALVPIPLAAWQGAPGRVEARAALGVPDHVILLVTVARAKKFRPSAGQDFWVTSARLLERHPSAQLHVVGVAADDLSPQRRAALHPRVHLAGELEDVSSYLAAADVFLESFPFGGQTALLEAGLAGVAAVRAPVSPFPLLIADDRSLDGLLPRAATEAAYLDVVSELVDNGALRRERADTLQRAVAREHVGEGWLQHLAAFYAHVDRVAHRPQRLPVARLTESVPDVTLASWQADTASITAAEIEAQARQLVFDAAYLARESGDLRAAYRLLRHDQRTWGWRRAVVAAASKLLPYWILFGVRRRRVTIGVRGRAPGAGSASCDTPPPLPGATS